MTAATLYGVTKRLLDIVFATVGIALLLVPGVLIALLVKVTSRGPALSWSSRSGRYNTEFLMPKFRTMRVDTPVVATHLLSNPDRFLTPVGGFLRRTSLDELPQLWCILRGQMALVGPRPALFNQEDLIALREKSGVDKLRPGLTGWAQVNGRDALSVEEKVQYDVYYLDNQSLLLDARILILTAFRVLTARDVSH